MIKSADGAICLRNITDDWTDNAAGWIGEAAAAPVEAGSTRASDSVL